MPSFSTSLCAFCLFLTMLLESSLSSHFFFFQLWLLERRKERFDEMLALWLVPCLELKQLVD